tara:strand:+ start:1757 stop:2419 length:663 start_codon:yes stop_codon:yes gene_type:complete
MFRSISKPFKRWAFNRAKIYTNYYIKIYNKKYIIKFLNKRRKLAKLKNNNRLIILIDKLIDIDLLDSIYINFNNNIIYNDKEEESLILLINTHLINTSDIVNIYDYVFIFDFVNYIINLNNIKKKDLGLDHSKVREYWLKRGPRIFITSIIFVVINYLLYRYFKKIDYETNIYLISINIIALFLSFYMLYYRLPDSIESAVARTTHDYYVKYKENLSLFA